MKFRVDLKILFFLVLFIFTGQVQIYLFVLLFALLHELAHFLVGRVLRFKVQEVEMMPFGFWISLKPRIEDYRRKVLKSNMIELKYIFVAVAGPLLNLILIIIFSNIFHIMEGQLRHSDDIFVLKQNIIFSNLLLLVLNLIPIYPLDGGRVFRSFLRILVGKRVADESINLIANISIIILTIVGSIAILYLKNIAIVLILMYLWELVIMENRRFKLKKKVWSISLDKKIS